MLIDLSKKHWQFITLLLLGLTWGSSFILMKQGLKSYDPDEVAIIRISASFLFLLPFMIPKYKLVPRDRYRYLFFAGLLGNGIPAFLFATAQTRIDSSLAGILNSTAPIFTLIVGWMFFSLTFKLSAATGIMIGLAGTVYLLVFNKGVGQGNSYIYAILPLIASVCYAFSTNIIKTHLKDLPALMVTAGALSFIGPPSLIYLLFSNVPQKAMSSPEHLQNLLFVIILGVVGTSLAVLIFNFLIKHTTVLFAASVTYLVPMFAISWGIFLGENITIHYFIGVLIILTGVTLANK